MRATMMVTSGIAVMGVMPPAFETIRAVTTQSGPLEVCDDGYSDACGTCNEDCSSQAQRRCAAIAKYVLGEACDDGNNRIEVCEYGGIAGILSVVMSVRKSRAYVSFVGTESSKPTMRPVTSVSVETLIYARRCN